MATYGRVFTGISEQSASASAHERERDRLSAQSRWLSRPSCAAWVSGLFLNHYERMGEPRSEEHTSELQSLMRISYAVFCLKKKKKTKKQNTNTTITDKTNNSKLTIK